MGRIIRSSNKAAENPYYAKKCGIHIYTNEELGYFIRQNLYMIDESFFNDSLKRFLTEELNAGNLADHLDKIIEDYGIYAAAGEIAFAVGGLDKKEKEQLQKKIRYMEGLSPAGKEKLQADNLMRAGDTASAIEIYRKLLKHPEVMTDEEVGNIYLNLAEASLDDFDWKTAGEMFESAYRKLKKTEILRQRYVVSVINRETEIPGLVLSNIPEETIAEWYEDCRNIMMDDVVEDSKTNDYGRSLDKRTEQEIISAGWNRDFRKIHKNCCQTFDFSV